MPDNDSPQRDLLTDLGRIIAGVGMLAVAAGEALAARRQGPKPDLRPGAQSLADIMSIRPHPRRKPPESGLPAPAVPPRGPAPLQGGAAARLDFEA
jgi:hypothetical protein